MIDLPFLVDKKSLKSEGIVLTNGNAGSWDEGSAAFCCAFTDPDEKNKTYIYYTGASDSKWSHSSIGVAVSTDGGKNFKKISDPLLSDSDGTFYSHRALTPAVIKHDGRYYMIFSAEPSKGSPRRLGIAWSDDPVGHWKVIGEILKPDRGWEGTAIDNGPSFVKIDKNRHLSFYSNVANFKWQLYLRSFRRLKARPLYRHTVRKIGILKLEIKAKTDIKTTKHESNPLSHLNGSHGAWNESLFCPGYGELLDHHLLFPSASTYSTGRPYRQSLGMVISKSPFFGPENHISIEKILDENDVKKSVMPGSCGGIALDTASPVVDCKNNKICLYYTFQDRTEQIWRVARVSMRFDRILTKKDVDR